MGIGIHEWLAHGCGVFFCVTFFLHDGQLRLGRTTYIDDWLIELD